MIEKNQEALQSDSQQGERALCYVAGWVIFGIVLGVTLAAIFFAYGQPELLLEQMNLRYCG